MKFEAAYLASALALTALFSAPVAAQETDWASRVTTSAIGGHVLGNPLARHKLVEYMSYTCNHCANFERQSHPPLQSSYLPKGAVSFEVRNLVFNSVDFTAALLARCGGRTKFFGNHRAFLVQQATWLKRFDAASPEVKQAMNQGPIVERLKKIANAAGFYELMKKRGYSAEQVNSCLASKAEQDKILAMTKEATQALKLQGTPSFTVNGSVLNHVHSWSALRPKLDGLPQ